MKCFHGTTLRGLEAIKNKSENKPTNPWCCSDNDGAMYFWPLNKLDEEDVNMGIQQAFESAQVQGAMAEDFELYVLEVEVPDELLEDDYSAENMETVASYIDISAFDYKMVVKVYKVKMNPWLAPIVIAALLNNHHFNKDAVGESLMAVAEALPSDTWVDGATEFDYIEEAA